MKRKSSKESILSYIDRWLSLSGQTGHTGLTAGPVCAARRVCITSSLQRNRHLSRMHEPEMKAWPGIQTLWSTSPPPPPFLLSLSLTLHPLLPSLPSLPCPPSPPSPHPQLAVEDGFSESSWDQDQRQITADVYAKCNMETPQLCPHYWFFSLVSHPLSLTLSLSPHFSASFLSKHNATQCEIWRKKAPEPSSRWSRAERAAGVGVGLSLVMPVCI